MVREPVTKVLPESEVEPVTESVWVGALVAIPTLPDPVTNNICVLLSLSTLKFINESDVSLTTTSGEAPPILRPSLIVPPSFALKTSLAFKALFWNSMLFDVLYPMSPKPVPALLL